MTSNVNDKIILTFNVGTEMMLDVSARTPGKPKASMTYETVVINNISDYSITRSFVDPCDKFSITFNLEHSDASVIKQSSSTGTPPSIQGYKKLSSKNDILSIAKYIRAGLAIALRFEKDNSQFLYGYIDTANVDYSPSSGTTIRITGRDQLSRMTNGNAILGQKVLPTTSIRDFLAPYKAAYGFEDVVGADGISALTGATVTQVKAIIDADRKKYKLAQENYNKSNANKNNTSNATVLEISGGQLKPASNTATVTTGGAPKFIDRFAKLVKKSQPQVGEGALQYINKVLGRIGYTLKAFPNLPNFLFIVKPIYDSEPIYTIYNYKDVNNPTNNPSNVLSCTYTTNFYNQPTFIYAEGRGGGGKNKKSKLRVVKYNELYNLIMVQKYEQYFKDYFKEIGMDKNVIKSIYRINDNFKLMDIINGGIIGADKIGGLFHTEYPCPVFIKDAEATTLEQLKTIVVRKMSALQMNALNVKYKVYGHTFGDNIPFVPNTIIRVYDEVLGIDMNLWCRSVTYNKSVSGGTTTDLDLILPYTYNLSDEDFTVQ